MRKMFARKNWYEKWKKMNNNFMQRMLEKIYGYSNFYAKIEIKTLLLTKCFA